MPNRIVEPLLYIDQPKLQKPQAQMQEEYNGRKSEQFVPGKENGEGEREDVNKIIPSLATKGDERKQVETSNSKKNRFDSKRAHASFTNLSIDKKIDYILQFPREAPRLKCKVVLENENVFGAIVEKETEAIIVHQVGRGRKRILMSDIEQIHLIGF